MHSLLAQQNEHHISSFNLYYIYMFYIFEYIGFIFLKSYTKYIILYFGIPFFLPKYCESKKLSVKLSLW